jgi:hypothetical protein
MRHPNRPIIRQSFYPFALAVGTDPVPMKFSSQQTATALLYTAFSVSVFSDAANPVYLGDASVNATLRNGLEITPTNSPVTFSINNERQLYEVQGAILGPSCVDPEAIPFVVWDPSTIYFACLAPQNIAIILFSEAFK